jgi:chemotaxis protein MotB
MMKKIFYFFFIGLLAVSCVTKKKYEELQTDSYNKSQAQYKEIDDAKKRIGELDNERATLQSAIEQMIADTIQQSKARHQQLQQLNALKNENSQLINQLKRSRSETEVTALLNDLQKMQNQLIEREDALSKAEKELTASGKSLSQKEQELQELTNIISKQDSLMKNLRKKVADALTGFEGNGLEVINKNGKVYVSLEEQLLFKSGRWDVDTKGVAALNNLAHFLGENKDIHIVIEGHTDDVPYNGSGSIADNWDLSMKRATAIVRILLKNKEIAPDRITASGRAEFVPLDPEKTATARQKNRRTEIILSPNMDELMQALSIEQ